MSYNGSGVWTANSTGLPVVTGTTISSTMFNAFTADVATGLSTAICKDGQSTPTADIPMGNHKITGLAAPGTTTDAARNAFTPTGTGAATLTLGAKLSQHISLQDQSGAGDDSTDNLTPITNLMAAQPTGGAWEVRDNEDNIWAISGPLNITKLQRITGLATNEFVDQGTVFKFAEDEEGVIIDRHNTLNNTTVASSTYPGGDYSILENVTLTQDGSGTDGTGLWMRARASLKDVTVRGFPETGIKIVATLGSGGATEGNANLWRIFNAHTILNGGDGMYVAGNDANVGVAIGVDATGNGGWGINDESAFGNVYIGAHGTSNGSGPFRTTGLSAAHVLLGCYSELDVNPSSFTGPTIIIGGQHNAGYNADVTAIMGGSSQSNFSGPVSFAANVRLATTDSTRAVTIGSLAKPTDVNTSQHVLNEASSWLSQNAAGGGADIGWNFYYNGGYKARLTDVASRITFNFNSGEIGFWTAPSASANAALSFTKRLAITEAGVQIPTQTPASAAATGTAGTITWDSSFIYVCTATNTWKRAALSTW